MSGILITNGYVVSVDPARNVFPSGFVTIDGSRIASLGPQAEAPPADAFDAVIDASGCIVLPGLINQLTPQGQEPELDDAGAPTNIDVGNMDFGDLLGQLTPRS